MRRTAEEAAKTRISLLKAALDCFAKLGWQGATFTLVAQKAGVTRGAIHHYFKSKLELLTEALGWGWQKYGEQLFNQDASNSTEFLTAFISNYLQLLRDDPQFRALAITTVQVAPVATSDSNLKQDALDQWHSQLTEILSNSPGNLPAPCVAGLLIAILQGLTITAVSRPKDLPRPEHHDLVVAALVKGLIE